MVIINIQKKDLFLLLGVMIFITGIGVIISYGGNQPEVHGHNSEEIDLSNYYTKTESDLRFSSVGAHISGGLYGHCRHSSSSAVPNCIMSQLISPAICTSKRCDCLEGYTKVTLGTSLYPPVPTSWSVMYSCIKD